MFQMTTLPKTQVMHDRTLIWIDDCTVPLVMLNLEHKIHTLSFPVSLSVSEAMFI